MKLIGGQAYEYGVKGAKLNAVKTVAVGEQRAALKAIAKLYGMPVVYLFLRIYDPSCLPMPMAMALRVRVFSTQTGLTFDPMGAAHTLSDAMLSMLLHPQRASRLVTTESL